MTKQLYCTVCNDAFVPGLRVMLYSMKRHVTEFSRARLKVFCNRSFCRLGVENRRQIQALMPDVEFEEVNQPRYEAGRVEAETHRAAFLTLEAFRQEQADQVIFFDADMLCLRDFSELFALPFDFAAAPCRSEGGLPLNTGFFLLNRGLIGDDVYNALLAGLGDEYQYQLDQPIINQYLLSCPAKILRLDCYYNYPFVAGHPDITNDDRYERDLPHIRILHWSGRSTKRRKPWEPGATDCPSRHRWQQEEAMMLQSQ